MTTQQILSVLEACPLLQGCGIDPALMLPRRFRSGQMVSDRAEGRDAVGLVAKGQVDVYSVAADGRDVQLNVLQPGECFGICNLLAPASLDTVLRCRSETTLIFIPKQALVAAMEQDAAFALRYATHCNQKIQFLIRRIELLTMQSCRGKLIEYLLSQRQPDNTVQLTCSRDDLARRLGVSRAALFRELAYLQAQGLLMLDGQTITLLSSTKLEQLLYQRSSC